MNSHRSASRQEAANVQNGKLRSESQIQRSILGFLALQPDVDVVRVNSGGYRGRMRGAPKGTADILGVGPRGRFVAIEVKDDDGELTAEQLKYLLRVKALGGEAIEARSIEDVRVMLERMRKP